MALELVVCGAPFAPKRARQALRQLKDMGFTSVQIYTFWRDLEPEKCGGFTWAELDRKVDLITEAGMKFVPFLLMGPRYAAPEWWIADPGQRPRCAAWSMGRILPSSRCGTRRSGRRFPGCLSSSRPITCP